MTLTEDSVPQPTSSMCETPNPSMPQTPRRVKILDLCVRLWRMFQSELSSVLSQEDLSFEQLAMFIQKKETVLITSRFSSALYGLCKSQPLRSGDVSTEEKMRARTLLAAIMVHKFPIDVLDNADVENLDPFSDQCYQAAEYFVQIVLEPSEATLENPRRMDLEAIHQAFEEFVEAFNTWKAHDQTKVIESLQYYYEQWSKSKKVLSTASLNDTQRQAIITQFEANMDRTVRKMSALIGREAALEITRAIDERVEQEHVVPAPRAEAVMESHRESVQSSPSHWQQHTRAAAGQANVSPSLQPSTRPDPPTIEDELRARGIPANMRSGRAPPPSDVSSRPVEPAPSQDDGPTILNLDNLIIEEGAKKYWDDFAKEIESNNFYRLFELLSEMLTRMKAVAPQSHHAKIDEILDVQWIQNTIEHGALDARVFYGIFHSIWEQLKALHAPAKDQEWTEWHDKTVEEMNLVSTTWAKLLPRVLNDFLCKLDEIEDAVQRFDVLRNNQSSSQ